METKIFLIGLLLTLGLLHTGLCRPQADAEEDSQNEEYQNDEDYDYEESGQDKSDPGPTKESNDVALKDDQKAYFSKPKMSIAANESQSITIPCDVKNRKPSHVILWYNGTKLLVQGGISFSERASVDENNSLHLKHVTPGDANLWLCKVLPDQAVLSVDLKVYGSHKFAQIMANGIDVSNKTIHYNPNKPGPEFIDRVLHLHCKPQGGYPTGAVMWTHNSNTTRTAYLSIKEPTLKNAGLYQCVGDNKIGKPVHTTVTLVVQHKPKFHKMEDHVNTGIGYDVELHCLFEANPEPTHVHWYRETTERVHENEKYKIINDFDRKGRSRTSLRITNVNQQDLVKYKCEVENELGKAQSVVMLDLHPGTPHLHSQEYNNGVLTTTWTAKSLQPLSELQVSYQKEKDEKWIHESAVITEKNSPHNSHWTAKSEIKLEPGTYSVQAKVKNTEGWSVLPSEIHELTLESLDIPDQINFVEDDNNSVIKAGFGIKDNSPGSSTVIRISTLTLALLTPALLFI